MMIDTKMRDLEVLAGEDHTSGCFTLCNIVLSVLDGYCPGHREAQVDQSMTKRRLLLVFASALLGIVTDEEFVELKAIMRLDGAMLPDALESIIEVYRHAHPFLVRSAAVRLNQWICGCSDSQIELVRKHLLLLSDELKNAVRAEKLMLAGVVREECCE